MLYRSLKRLISLARWLFFERITARGHPRETGPLVIVAPHPYSVMDPILVAFAYGREVDIVAKAPLFGPRERDMAMLPSWKRPLIRMQRHLLRTMRMHPIHREVDGATASDMKLNLKKLDELADVVATGGCVLIFAEGQSDRPRRVIDDILDGPARIALNAFPKLTGHARREDVAIQVVGLDYADFRDPFQSTVTLNFLEPFSIAQQGFGEKANGRSKRNAYAAVTALIHDKMRESIAEVSGEHAALIEGVQNFYRGDFPDDHQRINLAAAYVNAFDPQDRTRIAGLSADLERYFALRRELHMRTGEEREPLAPKLPRLLYWPFAWMGFLLHYVPYWLTRRQIRVDNTHPASLGYAKFAHGVKNVGMWYAVLVFAAIVIAQLLSFPAALEFGVAVIALAAVALLGLVAVKYLRLANAVAWPLTLRPKYFRFRRLSRSIHARLEEARLQAEARMRASA